MSALGNFFRWPTEMKKMALEVLLLSVWYRWAILHQPFKKLSPKIGVLNYETPEKMEYRSAALAVRTAVDAVCKRTPWESTCLVRALTAKKMLNRRGAACTLYMGVKSSKTGGMEAHAWLRCGDVFVTGGEGQQEFVVTTRYGDRI